MKTLFLDPSETVRIELTAEDHPTLDGEWVDVRRTISGTERKEIVSGKRQGLQTDQGDGATIILDVTGAEVRRLLAWLRGWSLTDHRGKPTKPSEELIRRLPADVLDALTEVILAHDEDGQALADRHPKAEDSSGQEPEGETSSET